MLPLSVGFSADMKMKSFFIIIITWFTLILDWHTMFLPPKLSWAIYLFTSTSWTSNIVVWQSMLTGYHDTDNSSSYTKFISTKDQVNLHTSDSGKPHTVGSLHPKTTPDSQGPTKMQSLFLRLGTVLGAHVTNIYYPHFNQLMLQDWNAHQQIVSASPQSCMYQILSLYMHHSVQ
jgi:hypothetical protein